MKKLCDHMKDMGFNPSASADVKKAFIKYLMREANAQSRVTAIHRYQAANAVVDVNEKSKAEVGEQLSLFDQTGTD